MAVLAARILLPAGFGAFTFALGVGRLGGRLGGLGWPTLINRFLPKYRLAEDWGNLRGLLRSAHFTVAAGACIIFFICIFLSALVGPDDPLHQGLIFGAMLIPIMAFRSLYRNTLAALREPQVGIFIDEFLPPVTMALVLVFFLGTTFPPEHAIALYIIASAMAVLFGGLWIRNKLPSKAKGANPNYTMIWNWMGTALPALVGMSAQLLMSKTDVLMLAPLGTFEDVGRYSAALRATYVQTAAVVVLSTVITARISEAFAAGRDRHGRRLFVGALIFALSCSLPFCILLIYFDSWVMETFFGSSYEAGASVLSILAISQVGAAINIPATSFMLMTGRQSIFGIVTVGALLINILANFALIPEYGAVGAAFATTASVLFLTSSELLICYLIVRSGRFSEASKS